MKKFIFIIVVFFLNDITNAKAQTNPSIICEGYLQEISCPQNQFIKINSAFYGRDDMITCAIGDTSNTSCSAQESIQILRKICNGLNYCSYLVNNDQFGDPCPGIYKYGRVQYSCKDFCPGGSYLSDSFDCVECPAGTYSSSLQATSISTCTLCRPGTYSENGASFCTQCPSGKFTNSTGATSKDQCDIPMALVDYECERSSVSLVCLSNLSIKILNGFYGRDDVSTCQVGDTSNTVCSSPSADNVIKSLCDGKQSCSFAFINHLFGDPCPGTFKYGQVFYTCL